MLGFDFRALPLAGNGAVIAVAGVVVWWLGIRLSNDGDKIADRTGLGRAFVGLLLLAGATSLPEISTTVTAATIGNAALAINNLYGGIVLQTAVLAIADAMIGRDALTYFTPRPVLLLQGTLLICLITASLIGFLLGDGPAYYGVSLWSVGLFAAYLLTLFLLHRYEGREGWRAIDIPREAERSSGEQGAARTSAEDGATADPLWRIGLRFAGASVGVLTAGIVLTRAADAVVEQTGVAASFVGATLLAFATSLPELSTTLQATRIGAYSMAVSNVFGSNALMVALVLPADIFYRPAGLLSAAGRPVQFAALAGILATAVYLIGLIERRDRVIFRMGIDSAVVLVLYAVSVAVLYTLR